MSRVIPIPTEFQTKIENDLNAIAKQFRKRREELEFTQENIAQRLNCEITTVQAYEQRRKHPSLTTFLLLCHILKIKMVLK